MFNTTSSLLNCLVYLFRDLTFNNMIQRKVFSLFFSFYINAAPRDCLNMIKTRRDYKVKESNENIIMTKEIVYVHIYWFSKKHLIVYFYARRTPKRSQSHYNNVCPLSPSHSAKEFLFFAPSQSALSFFRFACFIWGV